MDFLKQSVNLPAFKAVKNEICKNHTLMTIEHIFQGSPWALNMFDSSTKIPEGVLMGTIAHLGNFDECLGVNVNEDWGSFKGQHCMASVTRNMSGFVREVKSWTFRWAVCIPSSCSAADLKDFLTTAYHFNINVNPLECHTQGSRSFLPLDWLAIAILGFFGLLCILSTGYDIAVTDLRNRREGLLIFSWYMNGKRLMSTKSSGSILECLHGIRFLSIIWIVFGHVICIAVTSPQVNMLNYERKMRDWGHVAVPGALFAVDSFLLVSGTLLCYTFMKTSKDVNFNLPLYILYRYMRTTPLMAVLILVYTSLILHLGSGPMWDSYFHSTHVDICKRNWWTAIFHIQNYVHPTEMCIVETWYLSVDMQLYLCSFLLLLPLCKKPKTGLILLEVVTAGSLISCFLELCLNNEVISLFNDVPSYSYAHTRAAPWFIGMNLGYYLFHTIQLRKDIAAGRRSGLSKKVVGVGWLLAFVCLAAPIFIQHQFVQEDFIPSRLETAFFKTLSKPIWSLGISWIIFACVSGYGGPVNAFLSWKFFHPLSRLTYSIYLLHLFIIRIHLISTKTPSHADDLSEVSILFSTMVFTILLAIPASLTFEFPLSALLRLLSGYWITQKKWAQHEVSSASQQDDKTDNGAPHCVVIPGSSISHDMNTPMKHPSNLILDGNSIHNGMQ
ncbi:hypothetical protein B7P43_G16235 [Cryptotermes secundus]|uniref:Nose resistant-to-fluoxetine protein N-terminal domain-containing protein n=1 Tax=Cryptotermes secundus TaxID=105785 RepID=A0A2J7RTC9_9NEOP|nr:nose resistant to fluoxetine protein 6 [Cryptotermes secundus]PNF44093.1 hypothetical protein B7P43_G16235 [Cryptotermes secundus]